MCSRSIARSLALAASVDKKTIICTISSARTRRAASKRALSEHAHKHEHPAEHSSRSRLQRFAFPPTWSMMRRMCCHCFARSQASMALANVTVSGGAPISDISSRKLTASDLDIFGRSRRDIQVWGRPDTLMLLARRSAWSRAHRATITRIRKTRGSEGAHLETSCETPKDKQKNSPKTISYGEQKQEQKFPFGHFCQKFFVLPRTCYLWE